MNIERVKNLLEGLKKLKILVVGDIILDKYLYTKVERISPEAPVPVALVEREEVRLGGAGNVANNLASMGVKVYITGVIGDDRAGDQILDLLEENNIVPLVVIDKRPTTEKTRVIAMSQQLIRIDRESTEKIGGKTLRKILKFIESDSFDAVIVSDYAKGVITKEVIEKVKSLNIFWAIDPRPVNKELYHDASLMTPNEKELKAMMGVIGDNFSVEELGKKLKEELNLETLIVTRGPRGMTLFKEKIKHFPARAKKVYDVTGAGDTVIASLVAFYKAGASWEEACELANICAGIVVGEVGTATVKPEDILKEI